MALIHDLDNEYGVRIIGDGGEDTAVAQVTSASATLPAILVGRTVNGNASVAPLRIAGGSAASAAVLGIRSAISITSIILTSAAQFDYAVAVEVNGEARYIPLIKAAGLIGAAAHS